MKDNIPTPAEIIRNALEPALRSGIADQRTAKVLDALRAAGWGFVHDSVLIGTDPDRALQSEREFRDKLSATRL